MSLRVVLRPRARRDVLDAREWYGRIDPELGREFATALETFLERIREYPGAHAAVLKDVRRGQLRRFPYPVYYRVLDDRLQVIAVLHSSRNPRVWRRRV
jgi:toxin ParE1/3/4